ncbi:MAG: site-specific DNA-methyltransferase [Persephonella sp.]|nr:MAG: site-specific DNA-methyltransferase [Persephonella sp.]RUM62059.1 MAG: site-specific DNA-methyltransferase [Persephonella sp.]
MKYLKDKETKELKVRLKWNIFESLREISSIEGKSFNYVVNELLSRILGNTGNKNNMDYYFKEKPNLVFNKKNIKLFHNDFIKVDLSEYMGKVNLLITSPPYNLSIEYGKHNDTLDYEDYLDFTEKWLRKSYELLADDGRICINIPLDKNKNGLKPIYADFVKVAKEIGFNYQSTIIWNEQNISKRTAWGSWLSSSAPYVIAPVEMIVVMYKKQWKRLNKGESTIDRDEFIEWTNGVWTFPGESKKRIGHPAPYPLELPRRCIRLFSYKNDLILDPFAGSGTTLISAYQEGRKAIGIEIDNNYINLSIERIKKELIQKTMLTT